MTRRGYCEMSVGDSLYVCTSCRCFAISVVKGICEADKEWFST